jgi:hypothetical protein
MNKYNLKLQCIEYNSWNTIHSIQWIEHDAYIAMHRLQYKEHIAWNTKQKNAMQIIKSIGFTARLVKYLLQLRRNLAIFSILPPKTHFLGFRFFRKI